MMTVDPLCLAPMREMMKADPRMRALPASAKGGSLVVCARCYEALRTGNDLDLPVRASAMAAFDSD
jgi:hypothetical protein